MRTTTVALSKLSIVVFAALLSCACAYVPLSTMVKMYSFNDQDFAELDPSRIRVRVALPSGFEMSIEDSRMDVHIQSSSTAQDSEFKLTDKSRPTRDGVDDLGERNSKEKKIYTLRLTDESVSEFARLQHSLSGKKIDKSKIDISAVLKSAPCDADEVVVNVDLSPKPEEGFIPIVDGARIKIDKGPSGRPCTPRGSQ